MVVGDDHLQPQGLRPRHAGEAGNAVVHREQNLCAARRRHVGQLGREAVAVLEAVGHQKIHRRAHALQAFHAHGAGGGAIGIVIGHNQNVFPRQHRIGQPRGRFGAAFEALVRQKAGELVLQFGRRRHGARGTQARQQRVGAGGNQALAGVGVVGAGLDFGRHGIQMQRERRYCSAKRPPWGLFAFHLAASVGVKTRRLRWKCAQGGQTLLCFLPCKHVSARNTLLKTQAV
jgi:hypothetical protein